MVLTDRDMEIIRLIHRFRFCLGRHILSLLSFEGTRSCDRRLRTLVDAGFVKRKKVLYGFPYLYTTTHKGRLTIGANKREDKIRLDLIPHNIHVLDSVIYCKLKYNLSLKDIQSEKELHILDGFNTRKHQSDFTFSLDGKKYAVELERTVKSKNRLEKNIRDNYLGYDYQIWIVGDIKAYKVIQKYAREYSNMELISLEEVLEYVRSH